MLAAGPRQREAAQLFARSVVEQAVQLHTNSPHVLLSLDVAAPATPMTGFRGSSGPGMAGSGCAMASYGPEHLAAEPARQVGTLAIISRVLLLHACSRSHTVLTLLPLHSLHTHYTCALPAMQALVSALEAAVQCCPPLAAVAALQLLVAVRDGLYVRLTRHLLFQHAEVAPPMVSLGAAALAHRWAAGRLGVCRWECGWPIVGASQSAAGRCA